MAREAVTPPEPKDSSGVFWKNYWAKNPGYRGLHDGSAPPVVTHYRDEYWAYLEDRTGDPLDE